MLWFLRVSLRLAACALMSGLASPVLAAPEAAIAEIRETWAQCTAILENDGESWAGWRRDFGNGYADSFEFFDRRLDDTSASVLRQVQLVDGIVSIETISCFRPDQSLAFIYTVMHSPDMSDEAAMEGPLSREGRIYFDRNGEVIQLLGQIVGADGAVLGAADDPDIMLARGCYDVDVHRTLDDVEREYLSVLGDIEGNKPAYEPDNLDWCASAAPPTKP